MRKLLLVFGLSLFLMACGPDDEMTPVPDSRFYTPRLVIHQDGAGVALEIIDPRPFTSYVGGPPPAPDYFEVYFSTDGENYQLFDIVDSLTLDVEIDNLTDQQLYYFQVLSYKGQQAPVTSPTVMTKVDFQQRIEMVPVDVNPAPVGISFSHDMTAMSYLGPENEFGQFPLIYRMIGSGAEREVENINDSFLLGWSNTSNQFVYSDDNRVSLVDVASSSETLLIDNTSTDYYSWAGFYQEDEKFYYTSNKESADPAFYNLWDFDLATMETRKVLDLEALGLRGGFSASSTADGRYVYLEIAQNIRRFETATGELTDLFDNHRWNDGRPVLSPDNSKLAFESNRSGESAIWVYEFETDKLTQILLVDDMVNMRSDRWLNDGAIGLTISRRVSEELTRAYGKLSF